ncbi:MAG: GNAT family N-acetyltransferase [Methermicoccaceae archaeon]
MIRPAELMDLRELFALAHAAHVEVYGDREKFDGEKVAKLLAGGFCRRDSLLLIAEVGGRLVGFVGAQLIPSMFSEGEVWAWMLVWFVHKDFRRGTVAGRLLMGFEEWAREQGANRAVGGYEVWLPKMEKLFKHAGYTSLQVNCVKEL